MNPEKPPDALLTSTPETPHLVKGQDVEYWHAYAMSHKETIQDLMRRATPRDDQKTYSWPDAARLLLAKIETQITSNTNRLDGKQQRHPAVAQWTIIGAEIRGLIALAPTDRDREADPRGVDRGDS